MTIAQQLKIKDFPFTIKDKNGKKIYCEDSDGSWWRREFDTNGKAIYGEDSDGFWWKSERDANGKEIYFENSTGYWRKREFDADGNEIYCKYDEGIIRDNRPKPVELTLEQIAAKFGISIEQLRIKD